jgi:hypothetical protein
MDRLRRILKWFLILVPVALGLTMVTSVLLASRVNRTGMGLVPIAMLAAGLFAWRRYKRRAPKVVPARREPSPTFTTAEKVALASRVYGKPTYKMTPDEYYAIEQDQRERERLINLRGLLAYDLETQQTWNYDGTRKTPQEQAVAQSDTYTFEVTPAKYRIMQEWFDDALEPGVYTFKKERSGPVRIEQ